MVRKEKKCNKNKNLEKMHWSAADPTFQEATDYVMHFLMRQQQQNTVSKSPKMSLFEFSLLNETFWSDFQTLILHWIWFMLAMTNCDGRRKILNVVLGMWGECFIYFFLKRFSGDLEELCEGCEMAAKRSGGDYYCIWKEQWKVPNLWFNFAGEQRANRRHWCLPMLCHTWQWTSSSVIWRIEAGRYFY